MTDKAILDDIHTAFRISDRHHGHSFDEHVGEYFVWHVSATEGEMVGTRFCPRFFATVDAARDFVSAGCGEH